MHPSRRRRGPTTTVATAALVLAACLGRGAGSASGYPGAGGGGASPPPRSGQPVSRVQQYHSTSAPPPPEQRFTEYVLEFVAHDIPEDYQAPSVRQYPPLPQQRCMYRTRAYSSRYIRIPARSLETLPAAWASSASRGGHDEVSGPTIVDQSML